MPFHGGDHVRADEVAHELDARGGEGSAKQPERDGDDQGSKDEANLALEDGRILVAQKMEEGAQTRFAAGVDDMVGASQELIDVGSVGLSGRVLSQNRKVCGDLAVKEGHLLQFGARELFEACRSGLRQERREPVPVGPSLCDPLVGEDLRHGRWREPAAGPA